uniref:Cysteine desulfurase n=1 Tax=Ascaris lumbricoides TaxID=6252 RepID=A0A0M3IVM9_ASCLU
MHNPLTIHRLFGAPSQEYIMGRMSGLCYLSVPLGDTSSEVQEQLEAFFNFTLIGSNKYTY